MLRKTLYHGPNGPTEGVMKKHRSQSIHAVLKGAAGLGLLKPLALALGPAARAQQGSPAITRTIVYRQISNFQNGIGPTAITRMKMSADGSKIIFAAYFKKVFTINSDGTGLT